MPGYILHMTASQILFRKYHILAERNAFEVGNLIPDSVKDKTWSHFRHPDRQEKLIVYPDMNLFLNKYRHLLNDSSCLGYCFHLFVDFIYARDYLHKTFSFQDENGHEVSDRKDITHACIQRTGELVPINTIFSEEYYYGDFTKLNTYLMNRFDLSIDLDTNVNNPGIEEVNYEDIKNILEQLHGYLDVSENAVNDLRVFDTNDLIEFLENCVDLFAETYIL